MQNKKFLIKMDNQQGPTVQLRELCSGLRGSLDGRGVWGRVDACVCTVESLCCSPETHNTANWLHSNIR